MGAVWSCVRGSMYAIPRTIRTAANSVDSALCQLCTSMNAILDDRLRSVRASLLARSAELRDRLRRVHSDFRREREPLPRDAPDAAIAMENDEVLEAIESAACRSWSSSKWRSSASTRVCTACARNAPARIDAERLRAVPYARTAGPVSRRPHLEKLTSILAAVEHPDSGNCGDQQGGGPGAALRRARGNVDPEAAARGPPSCRAPRRWVIRILTSAPCARAGEPAARIAPAARNSRKASRIC